jgi:hypothetical protein
MGLGDMIGLFSGGLVIGAGLFALLGRKYLESYVNEKAKNLATREDIEGITHQIEGVKIQYSRLLEEQRAHTQLRLAAVDRRLQAHQEAFSLWRKLLAHVHSDMIGETVMECQSWWDKNCLYLCEEARKSFRDAYDAAFNHRQYLQQHIDSELVKKNFDTITKAGSLIVKGVDLPSLGEIEATFLDENKSVPNKALSADS